MLKSMKQTSLSLSNCFKDSNVILSEVCLAIGVIFSQQNQSVFICTQSWAK